MDNQTKDYLEKLKKMIADYEKEKGQITQMTVEYQVRIKRGDRYFWTTMYAREDMAFPGPEYPPLKKIKSYARQKGDTVIKKVTFYAKIK